MRIVGLDPSLTGFGLAAVEGGRVLHAGVVNTGKLDERDRFEALVEGVGEWTSTAQLVAIEGPSYGSASQRQTGHHERAGLWWAVVQDCWRDRVPVAIVSPATRAKYATGDGRADKAAVKRAASSRFDVGPVTDDNVADALTIAALAARWWGEPVDRLDLDDPLEAKRLAAVEAVKWPRVRAPRPGARA